MIHSILIGVGTAVACSAIVAVFLAGLFVWLDRNYEDGEGYGPHN